MMAKKTPSGDSAEEMTEAETKAAVAKVAAVTAWIPMAGAVMAGAVMVGAVMVGAMMAEATGVEATVAVRWVVGLRAEASKAVMVTVTVAKVADGRAAVEMGLGDRVAGELAAGERAAEMGAEVARKEALQVVVGLVVATKA